MTSSLFIVLVLATATGAASSSLRSAPPVKANVVDEATQVTQMRDKLVKISGGLNKMLGPKGELHQSKVSEEIATFNTELQRVLKETEKPKDVHAALKQLSDAQAGVQSLTKDITQQQVRLMHEGDAQEESLLLGVLMQKQKEPMDKQMEILKSAEFAGLKVVSAVLAAKDSKTPLFQQIATYLDAHSPKPAVAEPKAPQIPDKLVAGKDGKPDVTPIVVALEARVHSMEEGGKRMEAHHAAAMKDMERVALEKKSSKAAVRHIKKMEKSEERQFQKQLSSQHHDVASIKSAIEAVKKGDMTALAKAQGALDQSMKAAQARSGKFLVLIQMVHKAEGRDCPYCAAQCVDKCHNTEGKPYTTCLVDCADAGK